MAGGDTQCKLVKKPVAHGLPSPIPEAWVFSVGKYGCLLCPFQLNFHS